MARLFSIILFLVSAVSAAAQAPLDLNALIEEAKARNPLIQAARHQAGANRTRIDQARALDPPQIGVDFFQSPVSAFPNPIKDWGEIDYFVQQMFPFPGKRAAGAESARRGAEMAEKNIEALTRKVVADVKRAYYELYFVQQKIRINAESMDLMRDFAESAQRQYEVGMGSQADTLRAQTEASRLITEGVNLSQEKRTREAMLNTLLSRPADQPVGPVPDIAADPPALSFETLKTLAETYRPELAAMQAGIHMASADVTMARREYYPDLMLRLMYKDVAETGQDFWSTMLAVNIPLAPWSGGRYRGKVAENLELLRKAKEDRRTMQDMIFFQLQEALAQVETNGNLMRLYRRTVIPQAEQTLESTIATYRTGKGDFLALIDAYRTLLDARLGYHMATANCLSGQASLELAVGLDMAKIAGSVKPAP